MTTPTNIPSPMSPILKEMADYFLELNVIDEENIILRSYFIDYSDEDVMNAVHIFNAVLWTRYSKRSKSTEEWAQTFWETIYKFVLKYTGINTRKFYK